MHCFLFNRILLVIILYKSKQNILPKLSIVLSKVKAGLCAWLFIIFTSLFMSRMSAFHYHSISCLSSWIIKMKKWPHESLCAQQHSGRGLIFTTYYLNMKQTHLNNVGDWFNEKEMKINNSDLFAHRKEDIM